MNLVETNHQINHSASSHDSFKSHLNAKSLNMFLTLYKLPIARVMRTYKGDVNSVSGEN